MIKFIIFLLGFVFLLREILFLFEKQPNQFDYYFGLPGSGKSTIGARLYIKLLKKNSKIQKRLKFKNKKKSFVRRIFTTSSLPLKKALLFDKSDIGIYDMSNSLIIYDEAAFDYNNRDFKTNFGPKQLEFWKLHRHYNIDVVMFSQGPEDVDKKLRQLSSRSFHVMKSSIPFFIRVKRYQKTIGLNKDGNDFESKYVSSIFWNRFYFAPKYWKHFNSWDAPILKDKEWYSVESYLNYVDQLKKV